jgi:hypothetical protein
MENTNLTNNSLKENLLDVNLMAKIQKATTSAYQEVSEKWGINLDQIFYSRECAPISDLLIRNLKKDGVPAKKHVYKGPDIMYHEMVLINAGGADIIIDPTWQQFLEEPNKPNLKLPKILISKVTDLGKTLSEFGIPKDKHHIWLTAKENYE